MRKAVLACLVIGLIAATSLPCVAAFGGLIVIPTADVLEPGDYTLELEQDRSSATGLWLINTEWGVRGHIETGIDFQVDEGGGFSVLFDIKRSIFISDQASLALAGGIYSSPPSIANVPYVVVSKCFGLFRLHVGGQYDDGAGQWFAGVDKALGLRWTVMGDYTQGSGNYSSVGVNYQLNEELGLQIGGQFPNSGGDSIYSVLLSWGGNYRLCPRGQ